MNISGYASVHQLKTVGNMVVCSLRLAEKDREGKWSSYFIKGKFVGKDCIEKVYKELEEKTFINLTKAKVSPNTWTKRDGTEQKELVATIFDFKKFVKQDKGVA